MRRAIENELEHPVAIGILNNEYKKGDILEVRVNKGEIVLVKQSEASLVRS